MGVYDKLSDECEKCEYRDNCNEKRMATCQYIKQQPLIADLTQSCTASAMADIAVKHDYRDIKIDKDTTVTIDLEDIKKQIEKDLYKHLCPFNYGA